MNIMASDFVRFCVRCGLRNSLRQIETGHTEKDADKPRFYYKCSNCNAGFLALEVEFE